MTNLVHAGVLLDKAYFAYYVNTIASLEEGLQSLIETTHARVDQLAARHLRDALERAKVEPRERIHSFHRYFGKLIPAIPRFAVRELAGRPGAVCLDPFCGSGTTLVEAQLAGREAWGVDINPLAALIARAKTTPVPAARLGDVLHAILAEAGAAGGREVPVPYCLNMAHWFRPHVVADLARLLWAIRRVAQGPEREFFLACFSAVLRDVSNADPRHVFPGYSKRLRALDALGLRKIDVFVRFAARTGRALRDLAAYQARRPSGVPVTALQGDARALPRDVPPVDLVVTNPPYLGSIRYLETMKLEMFWLGYLADTSAYHALDREVVATERFTGQECACWTPVGIPAADEIAALLFERGHRRMARAAGRYFADMAAFLVEMARVVRPGGHLVVKISDSYVRELRVPTHAILLLLAGERGFEALAAFPDGYKNRSLLTRRNTYSRTLEHDWILVLRRG